jgi:two-component system CheB/CheR fusion protein
MDSSDAITVQGLDGRIEKWNGGAERMYGYSEAEALRMNASQLVPEAERQRSLDIIRQIRTGEPVDSVEAQHIAKDGRTLDVWLTVSKVLDDRQQIVGIATTSRDITQRKKNDRQLRLFTSVVLDSNDAITVQALDGRVEAWNRAAERMYGYTEAEALEMNAMQLVPETERERVLDLIRQIRTGEPVGSVESKRVTKDGRTLDVWLTLSKVLDDRRQIVGVATTERDVTHRKKLEAEIQMNQTLELKRFKELDELKTLFINTAAHELRTPLTPLKLQLHALRSGKRGALTPDQKHTVGILTRNFDRLGQLIEDILDVGRLQAGHIYIQPETLLVDQVVRDVVESFREMSRKSGVSMTCRIAPDLKVQADHRRITQVLFNILENALKFTAEGGTIQIEAEGAGSNVEIRVTDTGVGLRQEDIARLFRPFTQIHDPLERTRGGSGLGLYISSGLILLHGGTITCTSPGVGQGTTFTISLPVVPSVGPAQGPGAGDQNPKSDGAERAGYAVLQEGVIAPPDTAIPPGG